MKRIFMVVVFISFMVSGCSKSELKNNENIHTIKAEEAKSIIDKGNVVIVDVRTEQEYKEKHIPDALLVPNEDIEQLASKSLPDKDAKILVYCRSGNRSKQAASKLVDMGYTSVYDFGGIADWPYGTVK